MSDKIKVVISGRFDFNINGEYEVDEQELFSLKNDSGYELACTLQEIYDRTNYGDTPNDGDVYYVEVVRSK